jgi:hypothetical protein
VNGPADDPRRTMDAGAMPVAYDARNEFEAQCVRSVLEDAGIRSVTLPTGQGVFGFPLRAGTAGVPVRVLPEDHSRALQVIAEARWVGRSIDWDEIDVGDVPPEVARMLGRGRSERVLARAMMAVAWIALSVVLLSFVVSLVRAFAR